MRAVAVATERVEVSDSYPLGRVEYVSTTPVEMLVHPDPLFTCQVAVLPVALSGRPVAVAVNVAVVPAMTVVLTGSAELAMDGAVG